MTVDTADPTLEENKALVREFVERIFIKKDLDAIDELVTDDFVDHVPLDSPGGPAGFRAVYGGALQELPGPDDEDRRRHGRRGSVGRPCRHRRNPAR